MGVKESVRIFRFMVIGTMNALIMALVVWLMMKEISFNGDYIVANITAYLIAQIHNFVWCKYWIFPIENKKNSIWKQILLFCSAFGLAYTAQFLFLILLVVFVDATIAQEWPPATYILRTFHINFHYHILRAVISGLCEKFPLRTRNETVSPK